MMRYEKECKAIGNLDETQQAEADQRMELFLNEYQDICDRLFAVCEKEEQFYLYQTLAEQIKSIAEYLAPENEKERVKNMGGTVIKPQAQIILEEGIQQGIDQGGLITLAGLVRDKMITIK